MKHFTLFLFFIILGFENFSYAQRRTPIYRIISCYKELPEEEPGELALRLFEVNLGPSNEVLEASETVLDQKSLRPQSKSEALHIESINMDVNEILIKAVSEEKDQHLTLDLTFSITIPLLVQGKLQDVPHYTGLLTYSNAPAEPVEHPVFCNVQHF